MSAKEAELISTRTHEEFQYNYRLNKKSVEIPKYRPLASLAKLGLGLRVMSVAVKTYHPGRHVSNKTDIRVTRRKLIVKQNSWSPSSSEVGLTEQVQDMLLFSNSPLIRRW